jgi:hypothetical protein
MRVFKVELLIVDFDDLGPDGVREIIENVRYPNDCMAPAVVAVEMREIGEWRDDHPLNRRDTIDAEYRRLFGDAAPTDERAAFEAFWRSNQLLTWERAHPNGAKEECPEEWDWAYKSRTWDGWQARALMGKEGKS